MIDEGYIKYHCDWNKENAIQEQQIECLNKWRQRLYQLGLIGMYENGIGFGNVSCRLDNNQFIISGTQTGSIPNLNTQHYALVTHFDFKRNQVQCIGKTKASSEAMTHAVFYADLPDIQYVFHIHHLNMWKTYLWKLPTTAQSVAYGTPEMAYEMQRLFKNGIVLEKKILCMAGHQEGIFTFGKTAKEAGEVLLHYFHLI